MALITCRCVTVSTYMGNKLTELFSGANGYLKLVIVLALSSHFQKSLQAVTKASF